MSEAFDHDVLETISHIVRADRSALAAAARAEGTSPEDAVDCVQEALCTLLGRASRNELPAATVEWNALLFGIVRNAAKNRRRRHFRALPHEDIDAHPEAAGDGAPADEMLSRAEDHLRLRACVAELCDIQRAVVTLRMLEEHAGEDVARALGITPGHVAVLLHRAKGALRVCMMSHVERSLTATPCASRSPTSASSVRLSLLSASSRRDCLCGSVEA